MNYLDRLQLGVDHIEAELDFELSPAEVARAAGVSRWHFQRIFSAVTGETLKSYIRSRRLARSLERLACTDTRIIDIAIMAGFESQETFTRAFRKAFDMTPYQFRKLGRRNLFLRKARFDADYLHHITTNLTMEPEIIEQKPMTLVGMRTHFFSVDSEKNNIADQLPPLWAAFLARLDEVEHRSGPEAYGVVRSENPDSDRLVYDAAVEVSRIVTLPEHMLRFDVPAATYARFTHRGPATDLNLTVNYVYSTWLTSSDHHHTYGPDLEIYGAGYQPDSPDSVMGYAIPIGSGP
ncbi:AraC family transcriptional regulator [Nocardia noduli]|uniref:AraC family transcriptional regulator n=1 Tax=Nocardia noduli TaxID=2815722 RepID=UPI001C24246B|nr:GyrI-like domain-containing protein [Nocardia noduli]